MSGGTPVEVSVEVLGPLRVLVDGRAVEPGPRRRRALLAALAVEPGHALPLDVLADRVWSGEAPASTASTVQAYVSRLRQSLREAAPGLDDLLRTLPHGYLLDVPTEAADAHRFSAGLRSAHALRAEGDLAGAGAAVSAALALWRGPAYEDVAAEFARREADRLEELRADAEELAARLDLDLGRHLGLVAELPALLQRLPLREGLHATYVLALYRSGRQGDALAHLAAVRERLADELGVDPGPELRTLQEQVLRQDPALEPVATRPVATVRTVRTGPAMVGRAAERAAVRAALAGVRDGEPAVVAVAGEAGIGKTRLTEEVADDVAGEGVRVVWGRTWEHEGAPALWPWVQVVRELAVGLGPEGRAAVLRGRAAGVGLLVPELAGPDVVPPPAGEGLEAAQVRLFDAVTAYLSAVAELQPVLVVLEDLHWADRATTLLLEYLLRHLDRARLGVLATVRWPSDDGSRSGRELLTALARSPRASRVDLRGLGEADLREYVAQRTGSAIDDATAEALADRTGGNPFFVGELVRLLVTDDEDAGAPPLPDAVPDSVREVIVRRLDRLPQGDRELLQVAAVVGRSFDLGLLQEVSGRDEDDVDEALDRATALGVLVSDRSARGQDRHRFVHALTQQTILGTTGPARRRRLHGRVAAALDGRRGTEASELVFHLAQAGGTEQLVRAVEVSVTAADEDFARGYYPAAEAVLLGALELVDRVPVEEQGPLEMAVRTRLWTLYMSVEGGVSGASQVHRSRSVELVRRYGAARDVLALQQAEWATWVMSADLPAAEALREEIERSGEEADDDLLRVTGLQARAVLDVLHRGRPHDALAHLDGVAEILARVESVPAGVFPNGPHAELISYRATALALAGDETGCDEQLRLLADLLVDQVPTAQAFASTVAAVLLAARDDPAGTRSWSTSALRTIREHDFASAAPFAGLVDAWALERLEPGRHLAEVEAALALVLEPPSMAWRPLHRALVADVLLRAGRTEAALAQLDLALADADARDQRTAVPLVRALRAQALDVLGRPQEAEAERAAGVEQAERDGLRLFLPRLAADRKPDASGHA